MKFVIAPDKFKGSITGLQFCAAVESGLKKVLSNVDILSLPLADGGDGTVDILEYHLNGERINVVVNDPLFRPINASYLYIDSINTAFIEMAEASGIKLLKPDEQSCFYTSSFGTGEIIKDAIEKGAENIILAIGGSATNDCGIGMASALGYKFEDKNGLNLKPIGKNLTQITNINSNEVLSKLKSTKFKIACDVSNPLYGTNGAAFVYGPQKGGTEDEIIQLDKGLKHISRLFFRFFNQDVQNIPGSGAAGGMGAGSIIFLNAQLIPGIDLIKDLIHFDEKIIGADWVISGEGLLDLQTLSGKTIHGVLKSTKILNIPVAVLCGDIKLTDNLVHKLGIKYKDTIINYSGDIEKAVKYAFNYLEEMTINFAKSISQ